MLEEPLAASVIGVLDESATKKELLLKACSVESFFVIKVDSESMIEKLEQSATKLF